MTSLPAKYSSNKRPTTPFSTPWLGNLRRALGTTAGKPVLMTGFTITEAERRQIDQAISTLDRRLSADENDGPMIGVELARMLAAFPAQEQGFSAAMRIEGYQRVLSAMPLWVVAEACDRVVNGLEHGLDKRFAPSPPQMAEIARNALRPLREDLATLRMIAMADLPDAENETDRERVSAGFERLKTDILSGMVVEK